MPRHPRQFDTDHPRRRTVNLAYSSFPLSLLDDSKRLHAGWFKGDGLLADVSLIVNALASVRLIMRLGESKASESATD